MWGLLIGGGTGRGYEHLYNQINIKEERDIPSPPSPHSVPLAPRLAIQIAEVGQSSGETLNFSPCRLYNTPVSQLRKFGL